MGYSPWDCKEVNTSEQLTPSLKKIIIVCIIITCIIRKVGIQLEYSELVGLLNTLLDCYNQEIGIHDSVTTISRITITTAS